MRESYKNHLSMQMTAVYGRKLGGVWSSQGMAAARKMDEEGKPQLLKGILRVRALATAGNIFTLGLINLHYVNRARRSAKTEARTEYLSGKCSSVALSYHRNYHLENRTFLAFMKKHLKLNLTTEEKISLNDVSELNLECWHFFLDSVEDIHRDLESFVEKYTG